MRTGKNVRVTFTLTLIFSMMAVAHGFSTPQLSAAISTGPLFSITKLPDMALGLQPGLSITADASAVFIKSDFPDPSRLAPFSIAPVATIRFEAFWLGQSAPTFDGNLYRAWRGYGSAILGGIKAGPFNLPLVPWEGYFTAKIGAGLRATQYTGTGLASAHSSILANLGLTAKRTRVPSIEVGIPFEFAFKAGGWVAITGLSVGVSR